MKKSVMCATVLVAVLLCACSQNSPSSSVASAPSMSATVASSAESLAAPSESASDVTVLELPILDEINQTVSIGTAGSYMTAVQAAAELLDWGTNTGLGPAEIREATVNWLMDKGNDEQVAFSDKLALVDDAYQKLLSDGAEDLLSSAGLEAAKCDWGNQPVESIEAIMDAARLRVQFCFHCLKKPLDNGNFFDYSRANKH